jgi:NADH:ubiquinone oxidoreductase subunit C
MKKIANLPMRSRKPFRFFIVFFNGDPNDLKPIITDIFFGSEFREREVFSIVGLKV